MSDKPKYTVMGDDGKEYGPVSFEQVCDWIAEKRIETKTPIKPAGAADWVFIKMLPEFQGALEARAPANARNKKNSTKWLVLLLLVVLAVVIWAILKK